MASEKLNELRLNQHVAVGDLKQRTVSILTSMSASVGFATAKLRAVTFAATLNVSAVLIGAKFRSVSILCQAHSDVIIERNKFPVVRLLAETNASVALNTLVARIADALETSNASVTLNKQLSRITDSGECLESVANLNIHNNRIAAHATFLNAFSDILSTETIAFTVDITMPPGSRLIIDTENYTVSLNNENIIHRFYGDWPQLSRELLELNIDSGTGTGLKGSLAYVERWI